MLKIICIDQRTDWKVIFMQCHKTWQVVDVQGYQRVVYTNDVEEWILFAAKNIL
jgi:hypothetical protein